MNLNESFKNYRQNIPEVFDSGLNGKRLIAEVSETSGKLLSRSVRLVIVNLVSVVEHGHDVGVVVLVVVVEGVEEDSETVPLIRASENRSLEALG